MGIKISSPANPRVKGVVALSKARERRLSGLCTIEGHDELALAFNHGAKIKEVYQCPEWIRAQDLVLAEGLTRAGVEIIEVSPSVMSKLAYREHPAAWLAVAESPESDLASFAARIELHQLAGRARAESEGSRADQGESASAKKRKKNQIIVLESIEKPGNIGAVLRSADASQIAGILAVSCRTDLGNPNVVRASKGTIFCLPVAEAGSDEGLEWIETQGYHLVATSPDLGLDYWDCDFNDLGDLALALGAEREGLSQEWFERAATRVRIPMHGVANSLNIAQAGTLIAYEILRQRSKELG